MQRNGVPVTAQRLLACAFIATPPGGQDDKVAMGLQTQVR